MKSILEKGSNDAMIFRSLRILILSMLIPIVGIGVCSSQSTPAFLKTNQGASGAPGETSELPDGSMKVGWFLESRFQPYFTSCSGGTPLMKGGVVITSIPAAILKIPTLNVWSWVDKPRQYTVANAFSIISSTKSLPETFDPNYKLAMDPLQDPVSMLPLGTSRVIFSSNCTGILGAALDADAGITFPLAKVSAIVKADYQNTKQGELGMIKGVFNNPFFQLYQQQQGRDAATYAHFLLWDWYRTHYSGMSSLPAETFYALNWFNGFSMYWINKEARAVDGKINLSARVSYLSLASVSTTASAEYKSYGATELENFEFAPLKATSPPTPTMDFQPLESPDKIVEWAKQNVFATFSAPSTFSNLLQQNNPDKATHEQIIAGIPDALCNRDMWKAIPEMIPNVGRVAVTAHRPVPATNDKPIPIPSCALTVTFAPDDSIFKQPPGTVVTIKYALQTQVANKTLDVAVSPLAFYTTNYPMISPAVYAPAPFDSPPRAAPGGFVLRWKLTGILQDDPDDKIDPTATVTKLAGPTLGDCVALPGGAAGIPANGISFGGTGEINIQLDQYVKVVSAPDPAASENTTCTVAMTLRFRTVRGKFVSAALPPDIRLVYPVQPAKPPTIKLQTTPVK